MSGSLTSTLTLNKRKRSFNLYLSGGNGCDKVSTDDVSPEICLGIPVASSSKVTLQKTPIIVNGSLVLDEEKLYKCTFDGCEKAYRKPSRLAEHERSHTGERPFVCEACQKNYLRETHLQAHARSHLPDTARSFACSYDGCEKRFWTTQHLRRHEDMHSGEKPFKCPRDDCDAEFAKHHQLRAHAAAVHLPSGTKSFVCEHPGCPKSFTTSQKLKTHTKTHDERRYTCSHPACSYSQAFFSTWTALQAHLRASHPATCPYPSCNGKTFAQQKGLRAHLKLHEQREVEEVLMASARGEQDNGEADDGDEMPRKRRRGGELWREWKCEEGGCGKDFKSKKALSTHVNVSHRNRRDFICSVDSCGAAFGYKHLLQRHFLRAHPVPSVEDAVEEAAHEVNGSQGGAEVPVDSKPSAIDLLTGKAFADRAKRLMSSEKGLPCPFEVCGYVCSRDYDLRRHMNAAHNVIVRDENMEGQVCDALLATRTG